MNKILLKDTIRNIKKSLGRFISIAIIITLGVSFFVGVKSSPIAMNETVETYYDNYRLMDIHLLSTLGFNEADISAISSVEGVEGVFATYSIDTLTNYHDKELVMRVHALPLDLVNSDSEDYINRVKLIKGRLPEKSGETVVESSPYNEEILIGSKIKLYSGNDTDLTNVMSTTEYTVVGVVETPYYLTFSKGGSTIGSGSVNCYMMISQSDFNMTTYTDVFVTVKDAKPLMTYSADYRQVIQSFINKLESVGEHQTELRYTELKNQAQEELTKLKEGYELQKTAARLELENALNQIEKLKVEIVNAEKELAQLKASGSEISYTLENEIATQKLVLTNAQAQYTTNKTESDAQLAQANLKIKESEIKITEIIKPTWYVLSRDDLYSYREFKNAIQSIEGISGVFPVIFFTVAALVSLTTMTRMVKEQRLIIGLLKAFGYRKRSVAFKFIFYAFTSSILGAIVGTVIGVNFIPNIVVSAYSIMYVLPETKFVLSESLIIIATLISMSVTMISTYFAINTEISESPSVLLRHRVPKGGKQIIVEKIPFIWGHLSLFAKVTIRNIFCYKKRFLMTVVGISGCTALLLIGFGIKDSIQTILDQQLETIYHYDLLISLDRLITESQTNELLTKLSTDQNVSDKLLIKAEAVKLLNGNLISQNVKLFIPKELNNLDQFVTLQERESHKAITLSEEGIVITEKAATQLKAKVGRYIILENDEGQQVSAKVIGITENYTFHYVYISPAYYEKLFGTQPTYDTIVTKIKSDSGELQTSFTKDYMNQDGVTGLSWNSDIYENFENTIASLNYVVILMIFSSGALAFVVLYNITNVSISERLREIATIKVLGFYDKEVLSYIYRETIILTVFGTVLGLILGTYLHRYIMATVEIDMMMFGRVILPISYVYSAGLTIFFSMLVSLVMYSKLKKIKMVESLKSVD